MIQTLSRNKKFYACSNDISKFFKICHIRKGHLLGKMKKLVTWVLIFQKYGIFWCISLGRSLFISFIKHKPYFIFLRNVIYPYFGLVFHENKCWHCLDAVFSSNVFGLVHVDFEEHNIGHASRPLLEFRRNHFAKIWNKLKLSHLKIQKKNFFFSKLPGSTPSGKKVYHNQLVSSRRQLAVEFVQASNFVNHFALKKYENKVLNFYNKWYSFNLFSQLKTCLLKTKLYISQKVQSKSLWPWIQCICTYGLYM